MTMDRREFLRRVAAGGTIVTMPAWLQGCGVQPAQMLRNTPPEDPYLAAFGIDEPRIRGLMSRLTSGGADIADIYFQQARTTRLTLRDGVPGDPRVDVRTGAGMRVIRGAEAGFAFTEDLTGEALANTARQASLGSGEPAVPAPLQSRPAGDLYPVDTLWSEVGLVARAAVLETVDVLAKASDPSISRVVVDWHDVDEEVLIATLDGDIVSDRRPMTGITVIVTATRNGAVQSGFATIAARAGLDWYTDERLAELVRTAVDRAVVQFEARRVPTGEMPVILAAGESGVILHEAVGHLFEGDFVADGVSPLADRLGEKVASEHVSLVDDPAMSQERGALNVDDEGSPATRTQLIESGIVSAFLHDRRTALAAGVAGAGSGRRESYRHVPMPRMSCTFLENGPHSKDEIIASVDKAIVCETFPEGGADIGSGEFVFDVKNGWLVENGRVTAPVKDFRIEGNGADLLRNISMVADDGRMDPGGWICGKKGQRVPVSQGMPTVLVDSLMVKTKEGQ
ncbi:MAG: TldD/PmbA family protein [Woeseiaceae bacterium]|nr:TldD/PmbA family protein [Woeseiaceae bacterium]